MTEACVFGVAAFGIDHFKPKGRFPDLSCVYNNLYYCCNDCNRYKGSVWPSDKQTSEGYIFPDPCECDPLVDHLKESRNCFFSATTNAGTFLLEVLRLNREPCLRFRRKRKSVHDRILECRARLKSAIAPREILELLEDVLRELEAEYGDYYMLQT